MSEEPAWLAQYIEKAKTYKRAQSCNSLTLTLHAMLLKAIDLEIENEFDRAVFVSSEAIKLAQASQTSETELHSTTADLCTVKGRCLIKAGALTDGLSMHLTALKLYTSVHGINDGRSKNCVAVLRTTFRNNQSHTGRCWLDYFCKAHELIEALRSVGFLVGCEPTKVEHLVNTCADNLQHLLVTLSQSEAKDQSNQLQNQYLAEMIYALYNKDEALRQADNVMLIRTQSMTTCTVLECEVRFAQFNKLIQPDPILIIHRISRNADGQIFLYFKKGNQLANTKIKNTVPAKNIFKQEVSELNDIAKLFSSRLHKLKATRRLYRINTSMNSQIQIYFLLSIEQKRELENFIQFEQV